MKMLSNIIKIALLLLLTISSLTVDAAKRRSRIEFPIENAAEAPLEDNIATASGSDLTIVKIKPGSVKSNSTHSLQTDVADVDAVSEYSNEDMTYDECDSDNISFELVTGYASLYVISVENT